MKSASLPNLKNLTLVSFGLLFGYTFLLGYFNFIDPYHNAFFSTGLNVLIYNSARLFFIACLMWLFYAVGDFFLNLSSGKTYQDPFTLESALLAFFSGVGIWHITLLFIGFAGFYNRSIMAALTIGIFVLSLPRLNLWIELLKVNKLKIYWPGWLLIVIPLCLFLITKGLYPAGGHDYYNHYFRFYRKVTESGSILPNEIWYHFYYSKGVGLFFLSMLLTDPLAPQPPWCIFSSGPGV